MSAEGEQRADVGEDIYDDEDVRGGEVGEDGRSGQGSDSEQGAQGDQSGQDGGDEDGQDAEDLQEDGEGYFLMIHLEYVMVKTIGFLHEVACQILLC